MSLLRSCGLAFSVVEAVSITCRVRTVFALHDALLEEAIAGVEDDEACSVQAKREGAALGRHRDGGSA